MQPEITYHPPMDEDVLYKTLKNECEPSVMFAINRNLYAYVKITNCKYKEIMLLSLKKLNVLIHIIRSKLLRKQDLLECDIERSCLHWSG